ncbi:MAG: glucose 1-dehydrogenase [Puia sp.]|nr:glucose 1-dehydrogenase [Puia sp.]
MEKLFDNSVALVTGGGSGIGEATALMYAVQGAKVVVSDINETHGNSVVQKINAGGGNAVFIYADVSLPEDCRRLIDTTIRTCGRLDIAFNNAGIGGEIHPIADMSLEGWNQIIAVNLSSVFYCMKYEIAAMLTRGKGVIVNMSSILGAVGFPGSAGYVAAKHAVIGLTQTAALEYSVKGIRVNAVGPAFINTPLLSRAGIDDLGKKSLVQAHPIGRLGEPNEVAELVCWLSSDKASFASGGYYPIDGGYLSQ